MESCFICTGEVSEFDPDPKKWPVVLPFLTEDGEEKRKYHAGCVVKLITEASADLSLASSEALGEELMNRYDNAIIALDRDARENGKKIYKTRWKGSQIRCMGLAAVIQQQMFDDLEESEIDAAEEE